MHFCGGGWLYPVLLSVHLSTFLCNKSVACFWNQFFLSEFIPFDASFNVDLHLFILFGRGRRFWRESEKGGGITPERPTWFCRHLNVLQNDVTQMKIGALGPEISSSEVEVSFSALWRFL